MQITTFFMFTGQAEEAMNFYVSLFPNSRIVAIERYQAGEAGQEGTVKRAMFELNATPYICIDSSVTHAFTFTPAISLFVECETLEQQEQAFERLSSDGQVLMPLDSYGFSTRFAWVQDRYGVSWQLNLV